MIQTMNDIRALRNEMIASINNNSVKPTLKELKRMYVSTVATGLNHDIPKKTSIERVPFNIRSDVVRHLVSQVGENKKRVKNKKLDKFKMRFSTLKNKRGRADIPVPSKCVAKTSIINDKLMFCPTLGLGGVKMKRQGSKKKAYPDPKLHGFKIHYSEPNRWYVLIPYIPSEEDNERDKKKPPFMDASIDPGLTDFLTFYSGDAQMVGHMNFKNRTRLARLASRISECQSMEHSSKRNGKSLRTNGKSFGWIRRRKLTHWAKLKNQITDTHWKTIRFLIDNFQYINIGKLESDFIRLGFNKSNKKQASFLSHFAFRTRLINKTTARTITVVNEGHTTKTCSSCGWIHNTIEGNKTFTCGGCGKIFDRDVNAAMNIGYKSTSMTDNE